MRFPKPIFHLMLLCLFFHLACTPPDTSEQTKAILAHHLKAVGEGNLDEIMVDYAPDAVVYTPNGQLRGDEAIRAFFAGLPEALPPNFWEEFKMVREDVEGEIAYIVYSGGPMAPLGTDTFIIRNGKIVVQTFTAHMISPDE